ncbi:SIR2 family protein [Chryseobacterium sp. ERMR1:04]|uniref:SIR2 family protein n=1 Tax=Chryseobacterium sp. ERMR1:04 TaxID=1705393 RepID=UPI0006C836C8|nr:SIR2 family protein [Chryseobacterium sp. ERMR1:04]KPH12459.1 hypothetical protein AMQ68_16245 [Chryseobacterium sp. ERMR1:04]
MIDENLKKAIRDNKLVLFIGAGTSIPLLYPSWGKLVSGILNNLDEQFGETSDLNFTNLKRSLENGSKSPLEILNKIEKDSGNGENYKIKAKEYIYKIFDEININNSLDSDLHKLLWEVSSKIITTNYDQILEGNKPIDPTINIFANENEFMARKSQKDETKFLYKIHGDFKNPKTLVLFDSDYKAIYSNQNANQDALGDFFKNKTFLFLGFSLSDPFVNDLFAKIKSLYNNYTVGDHYILSTNQNNDFSKYDVKNIKIDNWDDSLKNYLGALIEEKNKLEGISEIVKEIVVDKGLENLLEESADSLFVLVKSKMEELIKNPSNKNLASEIHDIQSKINQLIYGPLNFLKTFDNEYRNTHLKMLFETIYGNEKLDQETINEINRIRTDYENHKWYERCQLVSAVTCSLFIFNKADDKKISLLVDFINDNEDKTWERALTYLVMVLNHLGNKWLRFEPIKKKVKSLTLNAKVQDACQEIVEYILVFGIGRYNFSEKVFENPYFREDPYNYFLPFFKENNPMFDTIYDNYDGENIERFIEVLDKSPYPDSLKYIVCNTKSQEIETKDNNDDSHFIKNHLNINVTYYPFAAYIQEFVSFINSFPPLQHKKLIDTQLRITSTPLKDYLLSEKEKFRILGIHFHKDKNWGQAIINFEKYIYIQPNDLTILDNLANCYLNHNNKDKAKEVSIRICEMFPQQKYNLWRLAEIYSSENNHDLALEVLEKYLIIDSKNSAAYLKKSLVLLDLKKYEDALLAIQKVDESFDDKAYVYNVYGMIYKSLLRHDESLKSFDKAISLDGKRSEFYYYKAELYKDMEDYEKAIEVIDNALILEHSDNYYYAKTYYLLGMNRLEESYLVLSKVKNQGEEYFNALANYYRLKGDYKLALTTIEKLISISDDKRFVGTKAAIYASMGDNDNFYKFLEEILLAGIEVKMFLSDVKNKYKKEDQFIKILEKYNQAL